MTRKCRCSMHACPVLSQCSSMALKDVKAKSTKASKQAASEALEQAFLPVEPLHGETDRLLRGFSIILSRNFTILNELFPFKNHRSALRWFYLSFLLKMINSNTQQAPEPPQRRPVVSGDTSSCVHTNERAKLQGNSPFSMLYR